MAEVEWLKAIVTNTQDGRTGVVAQGPENSVHPNGDSSLVFVEYDGSPALEKTPISQLEIKGQMRPEVHPDCFGGNGSDCMFRDNKTCCRYSGSEVRGRLRRPVAIYPACIIDLSVRHDEISQTAESHNSAKKRKKGG